MTGEAKSVWISHTVESTLLKMPDSPDGETSRRLTSYKRRPNSSKNQIIINNTDARESVTQLKQNYKRVFDLRN